MLTDHQCELLARIDRDEADMIERAREHGADLERLLERLEYCKQDTDAARLVKMAVSFTAAMVAMNEARREIYRREATDE